MTPRAPARPRPAGNAGRPRASAAGTGGGAPAPDPDGTRLRLLQAGRARATRDGLRRLTVRGVAADAGVNLGSFVYHFGTREAFVSELIEQWYAPLMARLQPTADDAAPPLVRLRALLDQLVEFLLAHAGFVGQLLADAAAGEQPARRFLSSMTGRHPQLVLQVIAQAQRRGELPGREPPLHLLMFLMGAIGAPVLALGAAARGGLLPPPLAAQLLPLAQDLPSVRRRIDWALRGLVAGASP
ncbi:TetR/AcrR family transcriptional regulator [Piscinibacter sakaiensis]|uniref:Transcriptional regulator, TetR family n=1 Tax=Piscinibacter sakaiensis TaxID=1547922 RepID=A0A0K8P0J9_PISS1|nr:TetR/AcrR family transcriptional regulator [Piscinibacter sakaiensis]GAP36148.1 transcriptional regulator, TetR family precursor [Piscinibacter sakaiensis]